jgi:hypothetical protein
MQAVELVVDLAHQVVLQLVAVELVAITQAVQKLQALRAQQHLVAVAVEHQELLVQVAQSQVEQAVKVW